ncbi:MAG TPA: sulfatase-like hydrolase/transferase [Gemmatimonadaceae bacterium]
MRTRLAFLARYFLFWVALFAAARLVFMAYYHERAAQLGGALLAGAVANGLRMDLSTAGYITVIPALLLAVTAWIDLTPARRVIRVYTVAMIVVVALLTTIDLGLFSAWGFRLDATPLQYLDTPHEMIISSESAPLGVLTGVLALFIVAAIALYRRFADGVPTQRRDSRQSVPRSQTKKFATCAALMSATALLVVPIRGGLQWTPLNQSSVYFSHQEFANEAALNVGWNFFHSLLNREALARTNPYTELDAVEARSVVDSLRGSDGLPASPLLRVARPNVILIVWESLTAKVVGRLGGVPGVTPHLDSLTHEGVFFDRIYASGDRSAQGLVAILSGFPTLPHVQIMNTPNKAEKLPALSHDFDRAGYATSFYYGGELAFANIKAYLIDAGFERIVGVEAFDPAERNSKWGAHDHVVLARLLADVPSSPRPFFTTIFTLSSHEPFDVPMAPIFPGDDEQSKFLNAHAYTDRSVGEFIRRSQREPWWDSTLVVIVADHGHPLPRVKPGDGEEASARYHVPMLWLGGALAVRDTVVHRIGSQTDLAPTLLTQLRLPHSGYAWGHDLLAPSGDARAFAYFSYGDGFGFVDSRGRLVYDAIGRRVTQHAGTSDASEVRAGLAWLRLSYQDYLDK